MCCVNFEEENLISTKENKENKNKLKTLEVKKDEDIVSRIFAKTQQNRALINKLGKTQEEKNTDKSGSPQKDQKEDGKGQPVSIENIDIQEDDDVDDDMEEKTIEISKYFLIIPKQYDSIAQDFYEDLKKRTLRESIVMQTMLTLAYFIQTLILLSARKDLPYSEIFFIVRGIFIGILLAQIFLIFLYYFKIWLRAIHIVTLVYGFCILLAQMFYPTINIPSIPNVTQIEFVIIFMIFGGLGYLNWNLLYLFFLALLPS